MSSDYLFLKGYNLDLSCGHRTEVANVTTTFTFLHKVQCPSICRLGLTLSEED